MTKDKEFAFEVPERKIKVSRAKKVVGLFPSQKNGRSIAYESSLERDYIYLLEYDTDVIRYTEQPKTFKYKYLKSNYKYTPDFYVEKHNSKYFVEIKPKSKLEKILSNEIDVVRYNVCNQFCQNNDMEFIIVTDEQIYQNHLCENLKYLYHFTRYHVPASVKLTIRNAIMEFGPMSIQSLLEKTSISEMYNRRQYTVFIYILIFKQFLISNLSERLNPQTLVSLPWRDKYV